ALQRGKAVVVAAERGAPRAAAPSAQPAPQRGAAPPSPAEPAESDAPAVPPVESKPPAAADAAAVDAPVAALDARVAELERRIAAGEGELRDYIRDPERAKRQQGSGDVAAIANRMPRLQDELRALRKQREAISGAPPSAP